MTLSFVTFVTFLIVCLEYDTVICHVCHFLIVCLEYDTVICHVCHFSDVRAGFFAPQWGKFFFPVRPQIRSETLSFKPCRPSLKSPRLQPILVHQSTLFLAPKHFFLAPKHFFLAPKPFYGVLFKEKRSLRDKNPTSVKDKKRAFHMTHDNYDKWQCHLCGRWGIQTPDTLKGYTGFRVQRDRSLCQPSL